MSIGRWVVLAGLTFVLGAAACDRHERPQGGRAGLAAGSPAGELHYTALSAETNVSEVSPKSSSGPDGAALYAQSCAACHQGTGQGVPGAFPPLDGSPYVTGNNVERLASIMIYGLMGPITVNGTAYNNVMLPQGKTFNDEQLSAIATYIRGSWSNKASGVEAAVFAKMRQKYGERAQFTIQELGEEAH